jgi:RNA polymerase sigma factor (sigma-70 family)
MNREYRNILIEKRLPEIQLIARRFWHRLPPGVTLDDLVQEANAALIEVLDAGGEWTWARVHGAMADCLRRHHPARRGAMPLDVRSEAADPEQLAIKKETRLILQRNAALLPERQKILLRLAARGVSGQQLARELRVGDRRARRLRKQLIHHLAEAVA